MSLAFLYAGQGTQHPGMGADLYEAYPAFRAVVDGADVDFDLKTTMFSDPDGVLNQTEYTQPCMVAFAAGMTAILAEKGIPPAYAAGLSLGEYSALQCAGVFTAQQAVSLAAFSMVPSPPSTIMQAALGAASVLFSPSAASPNRETSSLSANTDTFAPRASRKVRIRSVTMSSGSLGRFVIMI